MPTSTNAELFFLSKLEFSLGQSYTFYGLIEADTKGEFYFVLSNDLPVEWSQLAPGDVTTSIPQPFGMTGVELQEFSARAHIYKQGSDTEVDLTLNASAHFPNFQSLILTGAIVFQNSKPLLILVMLDANQPLTLSDFVEHIIDGGDWSGVTDQFALQSGFMYYLRDDTPKYTYQYKGANNSDKKLECISGYNLKAVLRIFKKYDFDIELNVSQDSSISLKGTYEGSIDLYLAALNNPSLQITSGQVGRQASLQTNVSIFHTPISGTISAGYDFSSNAYIGEVSTDFDANIPTIDGSTGVHVYFDIGFRWTEDEGVTITKFDGLPLNTLNLIQQFYNFFNNVLGGGCEKFLNEWFNNMAKTSITPKVNGNVSKNSDGSIHIPLQIQYAILLDGRQLAGTAFDFPIDLSLPRSLDDFPRALWQSLINSIEDIVEHMFADPGFYKAVVMEIAKRVGGKALARGICRSLQNGDNQTAEDLADPSNVDLVPIETLGDAAELVGVMMTVSLLGISVVYSLLHAIWNEVKKWFTGHDSDVDKANDKIQEIWDKVNGTIAPINNKIDEVKAQIKILSLTTEINERSQFEAQIIWGMGANQQLDPGSALVCNFEFLTGPPGETHSQTLATENNELFPVIKNWSYFQNEWQYNLNARVQTALTGYTFMRDADRDTITNAINLLNSAPDKVNKAHEFSASLQETLRTFTNYNNNGLQSDWVYAQSETPSYLVIGESRIGINTRIKE